ncbi:MAG TPA: DUF4232 domain-containing protein [Actinospica sp.]|nr:DUF4232 domain-containing protein [Actinospica sp.]
MAKKVLAACALAALALATAACSGTAQAAPASGGGSTRTGALGVPTASAPPTPTPAATGATASARQTEAGGNGSGDSGDSGSSCGNNDLKIGFGYGGVGGPLQATAVVFKNISDRTCTLQGYPGASIKDGSTLINAARVLNGVRGDLPPLTSPPLVTLKPGGVSYAILEWKLDTNVPCYPTGTGVFEITAPNTTKTVVIGGDGHLGVEGICSALEINPVVPGTWGVPVGR